MIRVFPRTLLGLALCALATGCITTAEQLAQRNNERCTNRGLEPGTKLFNDCLAQIENERDERKEANRRAMVERSGAPSWNRGE